jgi:hypothetical protein
MSYKLNDLVTTISDQVNGRVVGIHSTGLGVLYEVVFPRFMNDGDSRVRGLFTAEQLKPFKPEQL